MSNLLSNEKENNPKPRHDLVELIAHAMYMDTEKPFRYHNKYKPTPINKVKQMVAQNRGISKLASDLAYYVFAAFISGKIEMGKPYSPHFFVRNGFIPSVFMNAVSRLIKDINFMYAVNVEARKYKIEIRTITKENKKGRPVTYFIVD